MKARLPQGMGGGGAANLQQLARQAQKMQEQMEQITTELEAKEYTAAAGGGAVSATVTGKMEVKNIDIKPEVIDPDDAEMLGDLVAGGLRHGDERVIGRLALGKLRPVDELGQQARVVERGAGLGEGVPEAALAGKPQRDSDNRRDEHDRANERDKVRAHAGDAQHEHEEELERHED